MFGKCPKWSSPTDDMYTHGYAPPLCRVSLGSPLHDFCVCVCVCVHRRGIVPQAAVELFSHILAQQSGDFPVFTTVSVSFLEVRSVPSREPRLQRSESGAVATPRV